MFDFGKTMLFSLLNSMFLIIDYYRVCALHFVLQAIRYFFLLVSQSVEGAISSFTTIINGESCAALHYLCF